MGDSEEISFSDVVPRDYADDEVVAEEQEVAERDGDDSNSQDDNADVYDADMPDDTEDVEDQQNDVEEEVEIEEDVGVIPSPSKRVRRFKSEVKKPVSKWILFSSEVRPQIMAEHPDYGFSDVAKTVAERYRNISAHDSERFDDIVSADKERYRREMAEAEDDLPVAQTAISNDPGLSGGTLAFPMVRVCVCFVLHGRAHCKRYCLLPQSKVRKACKSDPEVKAISRDAVPLITKAVELFVGYLARKSAHTVSLRGVRSVKESDVIQTIYMNEPLEFLRVDFPRKPAAASASSSSKPDYSGTTPKHRIVSTKATGTGGGSRATSGAAQAATAAPAGTASIATFFMGGQKRRAADENDNTAEAGAEEEPAPNMESGGDHDEPEASSAAAVEGEGYVMVEASEESKEAEVVGPKE
jgi:histone H3/H4